VTRPERYLPTSALARGIWDSKYRYRPPGGTAEPSLAATWDRVAAALAAAEPNTTAWQTKFRAVLDGFRFLPAGRILAGAGTGRETTLANCFVMGFIEDSIDGIFEALRESALTMQWGGGIGCDFSTLRPSGTAAAARGAIASGPVSFMRIWDAMCGTMMSTGARRGAMMGTLRCDHPDIETFVDAKRDAGALRNFNLSVQVTDAFMSAVAADDGWTLCFPLDGKAAAGETVERGWSGRDGPVPCRVYRRVSARALWRRIADAAYDCAEPGVLFVDRINRLNNLYYCEQITSTNPCGEVPLPPNGACNLGSINLAAFVRAPFTPVATLDLEGIATTVETAVRMLDDVVEASKYPLPEQARVARATRRLGLGVTGLADALIMLGLPYDSPQGRAMARHALESIRDRAYWTSTALAAEKGSFPAFRRDAYLASAYVEALPLGIRDRIATYGIRNSHLLAIAPTGTISLLADNVSSGIEPVFAATAERRVLDEAGNAAVHPTIDYAYALWKREERHGLPPSFVTAEELAPRAHLDMLAELQPIVDNSISKTINMAENVSRETFAEIYDRAYQAGLKGCTVFRPNPVTGAVLAHDASARTRCCTPDREPD